MVVTGHRVGKKCELLALVGQCAPTPAHHWLEIAINVKGSEGNIKRNSGLYPFGFGLAFVSCLGHLIFSLDPQPI